MIRRTAYRKLRGDGKLLEILDQLEKEFHHSAEVRRLVEFARSAERGLIR